MIVYGNYGNVLSAQDGQIRDELFHDGMKVAVVRAWGKTPLDIFQWVRRMATLRLSYNYDLIILAVDKDQDKNREMYSMIHAFRFPWSDDIWNRIVVIEVTGSHANNWTRLLNAALAYLHANGVEKGWVLNLSFETEFETSGFKEAFDAAFRKQVTHRLLLPMISVRRCPAGLLTANEELQFFQNPRAGLTHLFAHIAYCMRGTLQYGDWAKVCPHIWRNTGMLWRLEDLLISRGFNPMCNDWGGMEDVEKWMRFLIQNGNLSTKQVFYGDPRVAVNTDSIKKRDREYAAVEKVLAYLQAEFKVWNGHPPFFMHCPPDFRF